MNKFPKISIITPSFNQADYLEKNIKSVLEQNYNNFEHIIIDGGSTDNTIKILKKYSHLKWIMEKDNGQGDAINKGLKMVTGEIIGWLNSDDYYIENIFSSVVEYFSDPSTQWIVSGIIVDYFDYGIKRKVPAKEITYSTLLNKPDIVMQQGAFYRSDILKKVGCLNIKFYMVMDYDLWVRLSKLSTPKKVNDYFACYVIHDFRKSSGKNIVLQGREIYKILKREKVNFFKREKIFLYKLKTYIKFSIKMVLIKLKIIDTKYSVFNYFNDK